MSSESALPAPDSGSKTPTAADVLRWCAAVAPKLWFPSVQAKEGAVPRDDLDDPVWSLRQRGLIQVADWVKGLGQGFTLTPEGRAALADPTKLVAPTSEIAPAPRVVDDSDRPRPMTPFERGEMARKAVLETPRSAVTPILLIATVGWFLVGMAIAWRAGVSPTDYLRGGEPAEMLKLGAVNGTQLLRGEGWRLVSAMFLHYGAVHLVCNMVSLAMLGPRAEAFWGRWRFAAIYAISGLAGSCLAMALHPTGVLAGASGAIFGVSASMIVWLIRYREHLGNSLDENWMRRVGFVLLMSALVSMVPGISWQAHLGGALAGAGLAVFTDWIRPGDRRRQSAGIVGSILVVAAGPAGLAAAVAYSPDWKSLTARHVAATQAAAEPWRADVARIGADRIGAVHGTATVALVAGRGSRDEAKPVIASLIRDASAVRAALPADAPEAVRTYVDDVVRYGEALQAQLGEARVPTEGEWKSLAEMKRAVERAYPTVTGRGFASADR